MLELLLGEPQQCTEPDFVSMDILQDRFGDHGNNELLDEREKVAVGVAHNLVELTLLVVVETGDLVHTAQCIRQETL